MKSPTVIRYFIFLISSLISVKSFSQMSCGTVVTQAQMVADLQAGHDSTANMRGLFFPVNCLGKKLSITAYIVRDSLGNDGITQAIIQAAVLAMNGDFAPMCLSFEICRFVYIDNYNYNRFVAPKHEDEVYNLYYTPNTINMYFVSRLEKPAGVQKCGYAYFPGGRDMIVLQKSCANDGKSMSHEMGHFFGLYHTFETANGVELINGTNCTTAGDLICDTPADPGGVNGPDCQLQPYIKDNNGNWYVPQIGNIMSYYSASCKCGFTTQQFNRMIQQFTNNRNYLW
ncbi:MAG: hypothetical protein JSS90_07715 [Bacteroidetes bacterium]|jgi:hypothetical protein|nr:hypothetical protein [Bacteroidota bacterium]